MKIYYILETVIIVMKKDYDLSRRMFCLPFTFKGPEYIRN